jgi:hypothetical protein
MYRIPVISSHLTAVGYDPSARILEVQFHSGQVYSYQGVTMEEYEALMDAPSIGSYFQREIRGKYRGIKISA